jgi:hypothetical protein
LDFDAGVFYVADSFSVYNVKDTLRFKVHSPESKV